MKLKIVHIIVTPIMAGAQKISFDILKSLPNEKWEKYLICSDTQGADAFFSEFENIGVKIIKLATLKRAIGLHDINCFFSLYKIFKSYKFDIVHTHSTKPGIVGRVAARLAGIKKIIHTVHGIAFHACEPFIMRSIFYAIEVFASVFCDNIVTVNKFYTKYYRFIPFVNVQCIYNGIEFSNLQINNSEKTNDVINVLFLARMDEQKNPLFLLKAINYLINVQNQKIRPFNVNLIGDGLLMKDCKFYCDEHNLNGIVRFSGWSHSVSDAFNKAHIFCVPSNYEAFGLVFVEAAYFSLPSISTNVEGIPEVVIDNKTGLLCEPNNVEDLARNLLTLINTPSFRDALGKEAKVRCEMFSSKKMCKQYLDLYLK